MRIGTRAFARFSRFPLSKSAPLAFWALIILPVSSIRVGIKRRAIVIIMENSCTGSPIFFNGERSLSIASVRATGAVVYVRSTKVLMIRQTILSAIKKAYFRPSG